jgi:hypothetical protein
MIVTLSDNRKARVQSIDLEGAHITFQILDADGEPTQVAGRNGSINPDVITFPVQEALIAGAIEAILAETETVEVEE